MIGYVWADEPRATAAAVVTGTDRAAALAAAEEIAAGFWAARDALPLRPADRPARRHARHRGEAAATAPVILADSGDNPTGGGVGDRADVLAALLRPVAGRARRRDHRPPRRRGLLRRRRSAPAVAPHRRQPRPRQRPGRRRRGPPPRRPRPGRRAPGVVAAAGITLVLAARRRPYHDLADFARLGLDPAVRLLVVKSGYLSPNSRRSPTRT